MTENEKEIYKLSNYANGLYVSFKHKGDLPRGTKVKLFVGDKFENGNVLNIYEYNSTDKKLNFIKDNIKVAMLSFVYICKNKTFQKRYCIRK